MEHLEQFRQEVRDWLEENCPPSMRTPMVPEEEVWGGRNAKYVNPESKLWLDRMGEKGWTAPNIPKEYGGGGLDRDQITDIMKYYSKYQEDFEKLKESNTINAHDRSDHKQHFLSCQVNK